MIKCKDSSTIGVITNTRFIQNEEINEILIQHRSAENKSSTTLILHEDDAIKMAKEILKHE